MSNAASTPEFRKIMQALYDSGRYRTTGEVLRASWQEYHRRYGGGATTQQRRYAMRKTAMGMNPQRELTVPEKHQLKIARDTLKMSDAMVGVMGGMNKEQAREIIRRLTGKEPKENPRKKKPLHQCIDCLLKYKGWDACPKCGSYKKLLAKNPGAQWHERQARVGEALSEKSPRGKHSARSYYHGFSDAHQFSAIASRSGVNPRKKINFYSTKKKSLIGVLTHSNKFGDGKIVAIEGDRVLVDYGNKRIWQKPYNLEFLNPRKKKRRKNPIAVYNPQGKKLPASNIEIRYKRTNGQYRGKWFKHNFKSSVSLIGLENGSIMLRSNSGKPLWGTVN